MCSSRFSYSRIQRRSFIFAPIHTLKVTQRASEDARSRIAVFPVSHAELIGVFIMCVVLINEIIIIIIITGGNSSQ
jgi:siroheme synthase (precorrin-2 oxidase/ferrochelatase)